MVAAIVVIVLVSVVVVLRRRVGHRRGIDAIQNGSWGDSSGIQIATITPFTLEKTPLLHPSATSPQPQSEFGSLTPSDAHFDFTVSENESTGVSPPPSSSRSGKTTVLGLATSDTAASTQKATIRQKELARQVQEMERIVAGLCAEMHGEEQSAEEALRAQVEALQLELERVKVEQEELRRIASSADAPPAYEVEDSELGH